jgi:predicted amino acid dehydrogenase
MGKFGFIIHPLCISDFSRKFPLAQKMPERFVKKIMERLPPVRVSEITGIESPSGSAKGYFVAVPLLPEQMLGLPEELVRERIVKACRSAQSMGAQIAGLGAFTSVAGDKGVSIAKELDIPVTTGNSYTVATALEAVRRACSAAGKALEDLEIAVVGANGSIGSTCAKILAGEVRFMTLISRDMKKLEQLAGEIMQQTGLAVYTTNRPEGPLKRADVVIAVSSSVDTIIMPEYLKRGAIVCDVARPRDVSAMVAKQRKDVLIIEGGVVKVPGEVNFNFNFGLPPGMCFACMAETMILAMEGRFESYSIGNRLQPEKVGEIWKLGKKHGFTLAGIRNPNGFTAYSELRKRVSGYGNRTR